MTELHDEEIMEMFCSGRTEAFQILFDKYKNRIFRFVYASYERNISLAEDYTQEIFLRLIKNRDSFNPAMRFSTWLYTIARNYCLNQIRARTPIIEVEIDELERQGYGNSKDRADKVLIDKELGEKIRKAVAGLPENLRSVFVLREDGLSYQEIAEVLNLSEPNVRTQLHRAKKQLREILSKAL